jgi:polysaccharide pyruvyl transferase CsaB
MKETYRVGISGSYGGFNLGDEAILHAITAQLRRSRPVGIAVFSRDEDDTRQRHRVDHVVPVRKLTRDEARAEVEPLDLLVLGGGGILYDGEAETYLREVILAQEVGVPAMVYAIGAGPLVVPATRGLIRDALNQTALITVRDRQACQLLEEVGVERPIQVTADPALLLEPEVLPDEALIREGLDTKRRLVGFSVREPGPAAPEMTIEHYHALLAHAADFLVDRNDVDIVFVPMERKHLDLQQSHAVVAQMKHAARATVLKGEYTPGQLLSLIGRFEFAVGMRLHFLIFTALQGVPFVALPYASKVGGFLEDLGLEMPPLGQVSTGQLIAHIDRCWDTRHEVRARIQQALPALQERARATAHLAAELLATTASARRR